MGEFRLDDKDREAKSLALEKLFGPEGEGKVHRDNFMLEADRDHFLFTSGFKEGCIWMLRRFGSKFTMNLFKNLDNQFINDSELKSNIVKFPG